MDGKPGLSDPLEPNEEKFNLLDLGWGLRSHKFFNSLGGSDDQPQPTNIMHTVGT